MTSPNSLLAQISAACKADETGLLGKSVNVASLQHLGAGQFKVTLSSGVDTTDAVVVVSAEKDQHFATWRQSDDFTIFVNTYNGAAGSQAADSAWGLVVVRSGIG